MDGGDALASHEIAQETCSVSEGCSDFGEEDITMEENTKKHVTCRSLRLAFLMTIILLLAYPKNRNSADAGGTDWAHFNQPTDVAIATAIFVADGYVNMRVVKYDHNRNFLLSWG